jgi:GTP-binding protein HflX
MRACVPYDRGDLVARVHSTGEVLATDHTGEGTAMHVRVDPALAAELAPFAVSSRPTAGHAA